MQECDGMLVVAKNCWKAFYFEQTFETVQQTPLQVTGHACYHMYIELL